MAVFGSGIIKLISESVATWTQLQAELPKINDNFETLRAYALNDTSRLFTYTTADEAQTLPVATNGYSLIGVISAASPGALTLTLPASANLSVGYRVKIFCETGNCNTYNITIARNTSQTINGASSNLTLSFNYGHYELIYVALNTWIVIGKLIA